MARPKLDSRQILAVQRFIAKMKPQDELTYRVALAGTFSVCRQGKLIPKFGGSDSALARCLTQAHVVEARLQSILAELG